MLYVTSPRVVSANSASRRAKPSHAVLEPLERRAMLSAAVAATPGTAFYSLGGRSGHGVSADGSTVVASNALWKLAGGTLVPLGTPPGKTSVHATAANRDGTAVVGVAGANAAGAEAFQWTEQFHYEFLGKLGPEPTQYKNSGATAVSADGSVVVGVANPGQFAWQQHAFRWTPALGMESLGTLAGDYTSEASGVSGDGSVIVGTSTGTSPGNDWSQAFRWTAETGMVALGDFPGGIVASEAHAISGDGRVIVGQGYDGTNAPAFRWTQETGMVSLGDLPGGVGWAQPLATNHDGSVIVGMARVAPYGEPAETRAAFIWDAAHGMRRLQTVLEDEYGLTLPTRELFDATGVSADGKVIVGNEHVSGWVVTLGQPLGQPKARVDGRHVFYNDSAFDGGDPAANAADHAAIATDKQVLLPGQAAAFRNVTSYSRGVNGVMIDLLNLPAGSNLGPDDFEVTFGNSSTPAQWNNAPAPTVTVRRSAVPEAPARVTLTWGSNAVQNGWLKVTVKANADTNLANSDTFYVGNLVGETGDTSTPRVNAPDVVRTRTAAAKVAAITNAYDFNRDGRVNVMDVNLCRGNQLARLYQFAAAPAGATAAVPVTSPAGRTAPTRRGSFSTATQSVLLEN